MTMYEAFDTMSPYYIVAALCIAMIAGLFIGVVLVRHNRRLRHYPNKSHGFGEVKEGYYWILIPDWESGKLEWHRFTNKVLDRAQRDAFLDKDDRP